MPAGKTYEKIASYTLASSSNSVTFSNVPQNYTDLVLTITGYSVQNSTSPIMRFNDDATTSYAYIMINGSGTASSSVRNPTTANPLITGNFIGFSSSSANQSNIIIHIQNYSNPSIYKTYISRANSASGVPGTALVVLNWRNTNPITSIKPMLYGGSDQFAAGTTFYLYGIECAKNPYADGGNKIYSTGTHWVHEFTTSGLFVPRQNLTADYLVVAGGGAGGLTYGAGGGAGGLRCTVTATGGGGSLESALSLTASNGYTVTVGAGGARSINKTVRGGSGNNSSIAGTGITTITSTGGGAGANGSDVPTGATGGSGGGGGFGQNGSAGTANQGYAGGNSSGSAPNYGTGGGGGAGAVGANGTSTAGGNGGNGVATVISGTSTTYAGGGGGGYYSTGGTAGNGGTGGGGNAGSTSGTAGSNGTTNLGGGGGGGTGGQDTTYGGNGGSGIVIVRYPI